MGLVEYAFVVPPRSWIYMTVTCYASIEPPAPSDYLAVLSPAYCRAFERGSSVLYIRGVKYMWCCNTHRGGLRIFRTCRGLLSELVTIAVRSVPTVLVTVGKRILPNGNDLVYANAGVLGRSVFSEQYGMNDQCQVKQIRDRVHAAMMAAGICSLHSRIEFVKVGSDRPLRGNCVIKKSRRPMERWKSRPINNRSLERYGIRRRRMN